MAQFYQYAYKIILYSIIQHISISFIQIAIVISQVSFILYFDFH
jgi:hypothetical protein